MGKRARLKSNGQNRKPYHEKPPNDAGKKKQAPLAENSQSTKTSQRIEDFADPHDPRANLPFDFTNDSILLVGDGDLSFAHCLVTHHIALHVTATTYDAEASLLEKYPQAASHMTSMRDETSHDPDSLHIHHGIDATRLSTTKPLRGNRYDRIVFNFPHVGGKSTDVNRQVRANQELLVGFFTSARPLLSANGTIIVTLFEGEPYTLWNVRDLGRHAGLEVRRSLRFEAGRYPGYAHARTLGNVEGGGGWKGEEREARMYIFGVKGGGDGGGGRGKRKRGGGSSDDEEDG